MKQLFKNWGRTLKESRYKYHEDVDFRVLPDLTAAKEKDPHPWNIHFLSRIFKVHYIRIPTSPDPTGQLHIDIKAEVLYGDPFTEKEDRMVGELLMELVQRNVIHKD